MKSILLLLFLLLTCPIVGQEIIQIDLSNGMDKETSQTVKSGVPFQIIIKNKLLNSNYSISVQKKFELLEQLALNEKKNDQEVTTTENFPKCLIKEVTDSLYELDSEKEISKNVNQLQALLAQNKEAKDSACSKLDVANAWFAISQTKQELAVQTLKKGEYLEVTISRKSKDEKEKLVVWKSVYSTQKKGKWLTTYGFTFIPESIKKSEPFFAKQMDSTFVVSQLNRRSRLNFAPSIFFTWFPYKRADKDFAFTLTGGLGYDFEAPTVFLGGSLLYNQNIGISFGLTAHQQEFLHGRYEEGDVLTESLGEEQLNEKLYGINPFISIVFRLGASPFSGTNPIANPDD